MPKNLNLSINHDIIDAYNAGLCGEELKGKYVNKFRKGDSDLPLTLVKKTQQHIEGLGHQVVNNQIIGNFFRAPLFVPSL